MVRAEETDTPPHEQEGRVEAARVCRPPSIPTRPQLSETSVVDREEMIVRPVSAVEIEATTLTSTGGSSPGAIPKKRKAEGKMSLP